MLRRTSALIAVSLLLLPGYSFSALAASEEAFFAEREAVLAWPEDPTANSERQLLDSVLAIFRNTKVNRRSDEPFARRAGRVTRLAKAIPEFWPARGNAIVPTAPLLTLHAAVAAALSSLGGMEADDARALAFTAQRAVIEDLGLSWEAYASFLKEKLPGLTLPSDADVSRASRAALALTTIDYGYDIPYLGGYARDSARRIYFDRDLPKQFIGKGDKPAPIAPYLNLHEITEKALLMELRLPKWDYRRCHQVAQRLEQAAVKADGHSWVKYQDDFFGSQDAVADKEPKRVPADFDLTPYEDMKDHELIKQLKAAMPR